MFGASLERPLDDNVMGGIISSSSQFGGAAFDVDIGDLGDLGEELARELGEGWGLSPNRRVNKCVGRIYVTILSTC